MKPLRALAGLAALLLAWLGWRIPAIEEDYAAALASAQMAVSPAVNATSAVVPAAFADAQPASTRAPPAARAAAPRRILRVRTASRSPGPPAPEVSAANVDWRMPERTATVATAPSGIAQRPGPAAGARATAAYRDLAHGDRRAAAAGFAAAAAADPADPRAAAWTAERRRLTRRWSGDAYVYARDAGPTGFPGAALLGGGQSGGGIAFTPSPLAVRPWSLTLRGSVAHAGWQLDGRSAQAAAGVRWQLLPGLNLSAERLIAAGSATRNDWTLRLAGGGAGTRGRFVWTGYAEAGVIGIAARDAYAAVQGYAGWRLPTPDPRLSLSAGIGAWGAVQSAATLVGRADAGPSLRLRWASRPLPVELAVDYRVRVAGNAAPGSGVAVTLSTAF